MKQIEVILNNVYNLKTSSMDENSIYANNHVINCMIISPHDGNNNQWVIRLSTMTAFDRWVNSCAIEETFNKKDDVIEYLNQNKSEIYLQLLEYLSSEYDELLEVSV